jgi:hypothetical protein
MHNDIVESSCLNHFLCALKRREERVRLRKSVNVECIEEEENKRSGFETEIGTSSSKN